MRWLYHLRRAGDSITARDGFVHCSFAPDVAESARLHFAAEPSLEVLRIDPRRLDARLEIEPTVRGPMPHVYGALAEDALREVTPLDRAADFSGPDRITGTRFLVLSFEGMTLLDLVGVYDPISRLSSMGFDPESSVEIASLTDEPFTAHGATLETLRVRPPLDEVDVLIVPGGRGIERVLDDREVLAWLWSRPPNRLIASVCTGALLLGQAGLLRGRRAVTHAAYVDRLAGYGARPTEARVVEDGSVMTAGGVTSGIDLGLCLVEKLAGRDVRDGIARQMEYHS